MKTFTIVDTETQQTREIKSNATTVAELKRDLQANGFNTAEKTIQEAITKIELVSDSSVLPHDVPYKGTTTNNLVFRLTKTNKNVKSGMDRQEIYSVIKNKGLVEAVKNTFGRNFTQVSTKDLNAFLENQKTTTKAKKAVKKTVKNTVDNGATGTRECNCMNVIKKLVDVLLENGALYHEDVEKIFPVEIESAVPAGKEPVYTKDELNDILSDF